MTYHRNFHLPKRPPDPQLHRLSPLKCLSQTAFRWMLNHIVTTLTIAVTVIWIAMQAV